MTQLKDIRGPLLDPLLFAQWVNRLVKDAVNIGLNYILQHVDHPGTYSRIDSSDMCSKPSSQKSCNQNSATSLRTRRSNSWSFDTEQPRAENAQNWTGGDIVHQEKLLNTAPVHSDLLQQPQKHCIQCRQSKPAVPTLRQWSIFLQSWWQTLQISVSACRLEEDRPNRDQRASRMHGGQSDMRPLKLCCSGLVYYFPLWDT